MNVTNPTLMTRRDPVHRQLQAQAGGDGLSVPGTSAERRQVSCKSESAGAWRHRYPRAADSLRPAFFSRSLTKALSWMNRRGNWQGAVCLRVPVPFADLLRPSAGRSHLG